VTIVRFKAGVRVGRSGSAPGRSSGSTDPLALASLATSMLPGLVIAALLLFRVRDPFGRAPAVVWAVPGLAPLAAVILGHTARRRARLARGSAKLATIGIVLGYLGLAVYAVIAVVLLVVGGIVGEP